MVHSNSSGPSTVAEGAFAEGAFVEDAFTGGAFVSGSIVAIGGFGIGLAFM